MKIRAQIFCVLIAVALLPLVGCGGGSSAGDGYALGPGGTSGTGITGGSVSSFGSVVVNGIRYMTGDTVLSGPYAGFDENDLAPGMRVQVEWSATEGNGSRSADTLSYRPELVGKVTAMAGVNQIQVIGRTVNITPTTLIQGGDLFSVGERLEISGILIDNGPSGGSIDAVRIGRAPAQMPDAVSGTVSNSRVGAFDIRDVSGNLITVAFNSTAVADDSLCAPASACTQLNTEEVVRVTLDANGEVDRIERALDRLLPAQEPPDMLDADTSGMITVAPGADNQFLLGGQPVTFDATTEFTVGTAAELDVGRWVRVVGRIGEMSGSARVLTASRIEVQPPAEVSLEDAVVADVSLPNGFGERTVMSRVGLEIVIRPNTLLGDDSDAAVSGRLDPATLQAGDYLEVHGYFNGTGQLVAVTLERDDDDASVTGCELEARISGFADSGAVRLFTIADRSGMVVAAYPEEFIAQGAMVEFAADDPSWCSLRPVGYDIDGVEITAGFYADEVEEEGLD